MFRSQFDINSNCKLLNFQSSIEWNEQPLCWIGILETAAKIHLKDHKLVRFHNKRFRLVILYLQLTSLQNVLGTIIFRIRQILATNTLSTTARSFLTSFCILKDYRRKWSQQNKCILNISTQLHNLMWIILCILDLSNKEDQCFCFAKETGLAMFFIIITLLSLFYQYLFLNESNR